MKRAHNEKQDTGVPPTVEASSISSAQPMATSTPGRITHRTNLQNEEVSVSTAIMENAVSSPFTSERPQPVTVVRTTRRPRDLSNTSLAQRVPRSFHQIMGRRPVHSGFRAAVSSKGRAKEKPPINLMTNSSKAKAETPKSKPEADVSSPAPKRQYSPEGALSIAPSTSAHAARLNDVSNPGPAPSAVPSSVASSSVVRSPSAVRSPSTIPSPALTGSYQVLQLNSNDRPVGLLILNVDQFNQYGPNGGSTANQGQGDQPVLTVTTPTRIQRTNVQNTPPAATPDNNTADLLPGKVPPKTKNCIIM